MLTRLTTSPPSECAMNTMGRSVILRICSTISLGRRLLIYVRRLKKRRWSDRLFYSQPALRRDSRHDYVSYLWTRHRRWRKWRLHRSRIPVCGPSHLGAVGAEAVLAKRFLISGLSKYHGDCRSGRGRRLCLHWQGWVFRAPSSHIDSRAAPWWPQSLFSQGCQIRHNDLPWSRSIKNSFDSRTRLLCHVYVCASWMMYEFKG